MAPWANYKWSAAKNCRPVWGVLEGPLYKDPLILKVFKGRRTKLLERAFLTPASDSPMYLESNSGPFTDKNLTVWGLE